MTKLKITGKDLRALGFPQAPVISIAMDVMQKHYKHESHEAALGMLSEILNSPADFLNHEVLGKIAKQLMPEEQPSGSHVSLNKQGIEYAIFGENHIEESAKHQMSLASKLPIAVAGALMPDAHAGYGLPIGGVLATQDAVIPYGVGVDIGCRVCLSIFDINITEFERRESLFSRELNAATLFGSGKQFADTADHEVLERAEFRDIAVLRNIHARAAKQLGTSGSGNHFVEFGLVTINDNDDVLNVMPGKYVGLLSHSGSRALGATIANHYTKIAKDQRRLTGEAANLAWLGFNEEQGVEYWLAMQLAGDYASACHHIIHEKIATALGRPPIRRVENHHNFAWKEMHNGNEVIVHRKGATPAGHNVLGIIPGSMTAPGFIVKGRGQAKSLSSASHGAGRRMSRTAAMKSISFDALKTELKKNNVVLFGGGLDEAPQAYKKIEEVMRSQTDLVEVIGTFTPRIVKMDG